MSFTVERGTLVNLGTSNLVLDGKPHESLRLSRHTSKGTYTYRYRYERDSGGSVFDNPYKWFTEKKPDTAADFRNSVVREGAALTDEGDGSKVVLRVIVPWDDR